MDLTGKTDEQSLLTEEFIVRAVSQSSCALSLLDAAMALRNGEITTDVYAQIFEECVTWADSIATLDIQTLKTLAVEKNKLLMQLCPPPVKKTNTEMSTAEIEFRAAMEKMAGKGSAELSAEIKKKMN